MRIKTINAQILVGMTKADRTLIQQAARKTGMSMSELMRLPAVEYAKRLLEQ